MKLLIYYKHNNAVLVGKVSNTYKVVLSIDDWIWGMIKRVLNKVGRISKEDKWVWIIKILYLYV